MSKADDFRRRAEEAERQAEQIKDRKMRALYLEMAQSWRRMAAHAEELDKSKE